jgi:hypothetical protein
LGYIQFTHICQLWPRFHVRNCTVERWDRKQKQKLSIEKPYAIDLYRVSTLKIEHRQLTLC